MQLEDRRYVVLTAVGPDRPGLVNEMSSLVHEAGANLEDSRMAVLGGEFAIILLISGGGDAIERVKQIGAQLETDSKLRCILKETARVTAPTDHLPYRIQVSGADRPGIVQSIASILAGRGVNVASLESRVTYAAESGTPLFVLEAKLHVPSKTVLSELRSQLSATCDEENLDFALEADA